MCMQSSLIDTTQPILRNDIHSDHFEAIITPEYISPLYMYTLQFRQFISEVIFT